MCYETCCASTVNVDTLGILDLISLVWISSVYSSCFGRMNLMLRIRWVELVEQFPMWQHPNLTSAPSAWLSQRPSWWCRAGTWVLVKSAPSGWHDAQYARQFLLPPSVLFILNCPTFAIVVDQIVKTLCGHHASTLHIAMTAPWKSVRALSATNQKKTCTEFFGKVVEADQSTSSQRIPLPRLMLMNYNAFAAYRHASCDRHLLSNELCLCKCLVCYGERIQHGRLTGRWNGTFVKIQSNGYVLNEKFTRSFSMWDVEWPTLSGTTSAGQTGAQL